MSEPGAAGRIVRFAAFEFDIKTGELRKRGLRIKLQGQPVSVLAMLIEHAGEVVTREELQKRLWPADTYVDFEHSLNAAIKRLRAALGDSANAPRYVETLPRQGYRFIAPLSFLAALQPAESQPVRDVPRADAENEKSRLAGWRQPILMAAAAGGALVMIASPLVTREGVLLAKPHRRRATIRQSRTLMVWSKPLPCRGTVVSWRSYRTATDQPTYGLRKSVRGSSDNLTRGSEPQLINPSVRTLGFSPDGSLVMFWARKGGASGDISIRSVPTLGGEPKPYLEGVAESNWSRDEFRGSRITHPDPEIRCSCQTGAGDQRVDPSSPRLPDSTATSPMRRSTGPLSTSSKVPCRTKWISGALLLPADARNGLPTTMGP